MIRLLVFTDGGKFSASLAQLVEQLICNQQVVSSNLTGSSSVYRPHQAMES